MKPQELRIGNWIYDTIEGEELQVKIGNIKYYSDFEPIPLTEEWLDKFGFEQKEGGSGPPINAVWDEWWEPYEGFRITQDVKNDWFLCGYRQNKKHFKYVHQLQNLYFALTGEELEIQQ